MLQKLATERDATLIKNNCCVTMCCYNNELYSSDKIVVACFRPVLLHLNVYCAVE